MLSIDAKDSVGVAAYQLLGMQTKTPSLLQFLHYASSAGGLEDLVETREDGANEFKLKVGMNE